MSSRPGAEGEAGHRHQALQRSRPDIPPIDVEVLKDLEILAQDVALKVDQMMKSLSGTIQNMTALSVGYIQTYRDSVDSLGESVDMSIKVPHAITRYLLQFAAVSALLLATKWGMNPEVVQRQRQAMYTLMARCEELDRSMQPIHALAKQIREIKRTLEMFETLCK